MSRMKFVVAFLFAIVALSCSEECPQLKPCKELLPAFYSNRHSSNCMSMEMVILCIEEKKNECEEKEQVEGILELSKSIFKESCPSGDDLERCFKENKPYIDDCLIEGQVQALKIHHDKRGGSNAHELECTMYSLMAKCIVDRTGEKCGKLAAEFTKEELNDLPKEIEDSCERANVINIHSLQLLNKK